MPAPYTDNTFTTAKQDGPTRVSFPFLNWPTKDNTCRQYTQDMVVLPGSFAPLTALSTWPGDGTFAANANIYLVEETDPTTDRGAYRFQRVYASIPATQNVYSSLLIVRPSLHDFMVNVSGTKHFGVSFDEGLTSHRFNTRDSVSAVGAINTTTSLRAILVSSTAAYTAGEFLAVWNNDKLVGTIRLEFTSGGTQLLIRCLEDPWTAGTLTATHVARAGAAAARYLNGPVAVTTKEVHQFYLPGVSPGITTPEDIPLLAPQTDPVSWLTLIVNATALGVVQGSQLKVWQGPIYEQTTIYAQMSDAIETIDVSA